MTILSVVVFALTLHAGCTRHRRVRQFKIRATSGRREVAGHVAERAAAEVSRIAPGEGAILFSLYGRGGDAQPRGPVERGRGWRFRGEDPASPAARWDGSSRHALRSHCRSRRPRSFRALPSAFVGNIPGCPSGWRPCIFAAASVELAAFPDGWRQRLLHEHVLAAFHGPHGGGGVMKSGMVTITASMLWLSLSSMTRKILVLRALCRTREDGARRASDRRRKGDDVFGLPQPRMSLAALPPAPHRAMFSFFVGRFDSSALRDGLAARPRGRYSACQQCAIEEVSPANSISRHSEPARFSIHYTPRTDVGSRFIAAWNSNFRIVSRTVCGPFSICRLAYHSLREWALPDLPPPP